MLLSHAMTYGVIENPQNHIETNEYESTWDKSANSIAVTNVKSALHDLERAKDHARTSQVAFRSFVT